MTSYQHIQVPAEGQKITVNAGMSLKVADLGTRSSLDLNVLLEGA